MALPKEGYSGLTYRKIAKFLKKEENSIHQDVTRGRLDIDVYESIVLYTVYSSSGKFRSRLNKLIANRDNPALANGMKVDTDGLNDLERMTLESVWSGSEWLREQIDYVLNNPRDISRLAINTKMKRRQKRCRLNQSDEG